MSANDSIYFYQYMALTRPAEVQGLIQSYGFKLLNVRNENDLATVLEKFCTQVGGEEALMKLAEFHPDKELLQTYFEQSGSQFDSSSSQNNSLSKNSTTCPCGGKCKSLNTGDNGFHLTHNQQTFLMVAGVITLAAIILK